MFIQREKWTSSVTVIHSEDRTGLKCQKNNGCKVKLVGNFPSMIRIELKIIMFFQFFEATENDCGASWVGYYKPGMIEWLWVNFEKYETKTRNITTFFDGHSSWNATVFSEKDSGASWDGALPDWSRLIEWSWVHFEKY